MTAQTPQMEPSMMDQRQAPVSAPVGAAPMPPATAPITGYNSPAMGQVAGAPSGWYAAPVAAPQPARAMTPSPAMRLGLAIVSLVLFIPLLAIGVGSITALAGVVAPWVALTVGLIIVALVILTIVGINLLFNYDVLRSRH
jgi:hypothetical protein